MDNVKLKLGDCVQVNNEALVSENTGRLGQIIEVRPSYFEDDDDDGLFDVYMVRFFDNGWEDGEFGFELDLVPEEEAALWVIMNNG